MKQNPISVVGTLVDHNKEDGRRRFVDSRAPITALASRTAKIRVREAHNLEIVSEIDTKPPQSDDGDTI